ncbi:hypothetical protein U1Q18_000874 [Sarracenia purpurea var. burkii]
MQPEGSRSYNNSGNRGNNRFRGRGHYRGNRGGRNFRGNFRGNSGSSNRDLCQICERDNHSALDCYYRHPSTKLNAPNSSSFRAVSSSPLRAFAFISSSQFQSSPD